MSISVVIPAYNASRFLAETLESVLGQTLPPDEILVIDDGSTDDTAAIAESFPPPVRVFRRPNSRQGASRNFGVQQATSEWIAFVDADDLWRPNKLQRQMEELSKQPEADVCYTGLLRFTDAQGSRTFGTPLPAYPPEQVRRRLFRGPFFLPSSVLIRRSRFLAMGGFATTFKITEDWDLWLRLLHAGAGFAACPELLCLYRIHPGSVSSDKIVVLDECTSIYDQHIRPHLSGAQKWIAPARFFSPYHVEVAYALRKRGDPRCLSVMTRSILQWPFGDLIRYKVWAHMLLTRLGIIPDRNRPSPQPK